MEKTIIQEKREEIRQLTEKLANWTSTLENITACTNKIGIVLNKRILEGFISNSDRHEIFERCLIEELTKNENLTIGGLKIHKHALAGMVELPNYSELQTLCKNLKIEQNHAREIYILSLFEVDENKAIQVSNAAEMIKEACTIYARDERHVSQHKALQQFAKACELVCSEGIIDRKQLCDTLGESGKQLIEIHNGKIVASWKGL